MEAAAKTINLLSQRVLPDEPHQLAYHPDWRYRPQDDRYPDKPEEWHNTRLQYMTFLSDAERGVLLTRSYDDMREEPPKPVLKEVSTLAKGGEKKKLSLSDYKNKKTAGPTAGSPPEPAIARSRETDLGATASKDNTTPRLSTETRPSRNGNDASRSPATSHDRGRNRSPTGPVDRRLA